MQQLYDQNGHRKYLTPSERDAFLKAADAASREVRTFCAMLTYTGCRISEALALTADRVELEAGAIVFENAQEAQTRRLQAGAGAAVVSGHPQHCP